MNNKYFFVDESGDCTFFDKNGEYIVGTDGCSPILIIGFIRTENPHVIRSSLLNLRKEILHDEYLNSIPSLKKTNINFHAKDDCPEVREKVFKAIKHMDFKAQFIVARKKLDIFAKRHSRNEEIFYSEMVSRLFERVLHKSDNIIYFSKRDNQIKQEHFIKSIKAAILAFEVKNCRKIETKTEILIQTPPVEPCLQVIDYINWALYRAFTKREGRYLDFMKDKISFICDIYDFEKYPNNFYSKNNTFDITKTSPLRLEG